MNFAGISAEQIQIFLLVFVRVTAILALLPILGSQDVPDIAKAGLSFFVALLIFPLVMANYSGQISFTLASFVIGLLKELFVGIAIGFVSSFLFLIVQFAGMLIDRQMGFEMVTIIDPTTEEEVTFSGQFQILVFTMVFLLLNGHYFFILAVQKSFELIPLMGASVPSGDLARFITEISGNVFVLAVQLSAPVFIVLFIVTLGMGIVARTVPQINVFFVGMPLQIAVGILTFAVALPVLTVLFKSMAQQVIEDVWKMLYLLA